MKERLAVKSKKGVLRKTLELMGLLMEKIFSTKCLHIKATQCISVK